MNYAMPAGEKLYQPDDAEEDMLYETVERNGPGNPVQVRTQA